MSSVSVKHFECITIAVINVTTNASYKKHKSVVDTEMVSIYRHIVYMSHPMGIETRSNIHTTYITLFEVTLLYQMKIKRLYLRNYLMLGQRVD